MPTELVWSNQARADLLDIYLMIGSSSPQLQSAISIASNPRRSC